MTHSETAAPERLQQTFRREHWARMPTIIDEPLLGFLWRYVLARADAGALTGGDGAVTAAAGTYADTVMEHVLARLRPSVEAASGLALDPTYSYLRLYRSGDALAAHRDRPACEISLSLNLGQEPAAAWPLWFRAASGPHAVTLRPGDAVLYRGTTVEHWREPYTGMRTAQVFLHYVDRNGPHAEWKYDKRDDLAMSVRLPI
jgi:hypothetical protein